MTDNDKLATLLGWKWDSGHWMWFRTQNNHTTWLMHTPCYFTDANTREELLEVVDLDKLKIYLRNYWIHNLQCRVSWDKYLLTLTQHQLATAVLAVLEKEGE